MNDALVAGLGLPPEVWLFLTVLSCLCLFFKFGRFWSIRNLDLMLLFAQTPGLVRLVGRGDEQSWLAFVWLFAGTFVWFARCLVDLGLTRRPLLEPNLNSDGLVCFAVGLLGLVLVESAIYQEPPDRPRNPGDPHAQEAIDSSVSVRGVSGAHPKDVLRGLRRVLSALGHLGITGGLIALGWRNFGRLAIGLSMAVCYLMLPYSRIALLDSGQLVSAAFFVLALCAFRRPAVAGCLIGAGAAWFPAALGLIPLWAGFYWRRGASRFLLISLAIVALAVGVSRYWPEAASWGQALGARRLSEAGLLTNSEVPNAGSFWTRVEPAYRLPVFVLYLVLVVIVSLWPANKNLGQLIALSAALLLATQFWYLDEGGTLVVLYLPLTLGLVFRPNLSTMRPAALPPRAKETDAVFSSDSAPQSR